MTNPQKSTSTDNKGRYKAREPIITGHTNVWISGSFESVTLSSCQSVAACFSINVATIGLIKTQRRRKDGHFHQ